jgi:hypothetical protein
MCHIFSGTIHSLRIKLSSGSLPLHPSLMLSAFNLRFVFLFVISHLITINTRWGLPDLPGLRRPVSRIKPLSNNALNLAVMEL